VDRQIITVGLQNMKPPPRRIQRTSALGALKMLSSPLASAVAIGVRPEDVC
jgi:hypothetical protein